jgi:hypothetical protein
VRLNSSHPRIVSSLLAVAVNVSILPLAVVTAAALSPSTTTVVSSVNPSVFGQSVSFTATVTGAGPTPTGTVTFRNGGVNIAGCVALPLAAGKATCVTASLSVSAHSITGVYSGDATYSTSTSPVLTQTVSKGATATTVASSVNPSVSGQSVTYTATVTATAPASGVRTGTVDFQDGGVTIAGCGARPVAAAGTATCTITYPGPGSHNITAVYSGDANFTTSTSATLTQTVNKGATTTTVASSVNPSVSGQSVTYTATVTATAPASGTRTGTVDFQDGGVTIAGCGARPVSVGGIATCAITYSGPGSHAITAVYSGDVTFTTSTSATLTQTVNKGNTSTAVASSVNPSVSGQGVTYTATVTDAAPASGTRTGTVDFQDGGVTIAGCGAQAVSVAGTATCAITYAGPGSHSITAIYAGDANFTTSTSATLTQTVNRGNTTTAVASSANPSVSGQTVTYTATVTPTAPASGTRTGTVDFQDGGVTIAGCGAQPVSAGGTAICAITYAGPGSHAITAVYSGDANFNTSTSAMLTQTVNKGNTTTAVTSSANPSVSGQSVTYTATVSATAPASGARTGTVNFRDGGVTIPACGAQPVSASVTATCSVTYAGPGSHSITAVYSGDATFNTSISPTLTQTVNKDTTTTAVTSSVNPSVVGQAVTYTATVIANAPGAGTPTGTVTFRNGGVNIAGCVNRAMLGGTATCGATYVGVGSHTVTAIYNGDASFLTSTSAPLTQTVNADATTTALSSSVNPSVSGQGVTYTATVTANAPGAGTPTGTVTFQDGGVTIAACASRPMVGGTATCAVTYAGPGSHSITGVYGGDANFLPSTSAPLTQTVNHGNTTTAVTSSANPSVSGQSLTYAATVTATPPASGTRTGTVNFRDGGVTIAGCGAQPVSLAGIATCTVTYAGPGSHSITAIYSGDANFLPSNSAPLTQTVDVDATTTALSSSVNPSVSGQSVTYTATATANAPGAGTPSGTVAFQEGGVNIAGCASSPMVGGTATCGVTYVGVGSHTITAIYNGDANFQPSISAPLTQTVNQDATTTRLSSSVNPSVSGQSTTYTATVIADPPGAGTPTGTVTFQDGGVTIAGCASSPMVGGTATCAVTYIGVGSHSITAVYSGDANFLPSVSAPLTQTVNQDATTTTLSSSVNPSVSGQSVTYAATVTANPPGAGTPTGTVTFQDGGVTIAGCASSPMAGGTATCVTTYAGSGSHSIAAIYGGDANFLPSTSAPLTQTVNADATTTALSSSVNPLVVGQPVTFTATVTPNPPGAGTPTGTVTFQDGGVTIAGCASSTLVGGTATCGVTYPGVGSHTITAISSGDANFLPSASAPLTQAISQDSTTIIPSSSVNPSVTGQPVTFSASVTANSPGSGTPTGTVTFSDGGVDIAGCVDRPLAGGVATCTAAALSVGSHGITGRYSGDANFSASTSSVVTQVVTRGSTSTTLTSSLDPSPFGKLVILTASVIAVLPAAGTPTGTVIFEDGGIPLADCGAPSLGNGVATCTTTALATATHQLTAVYSGEAGFLMSTSAAIRQTVNPAAVTVSLAALPMLVFAGQPATLTATITPNDPPTGTVSFFDGTILLRTVTVDSKAQASLVVVLPLGTHGITATYGGDINYLGGTSPVVVVTVVPRPSVPDTGFSMWIVGLGSALSLAGWTLIALATRRRRG